MGNYPKHTSRPKGNNRTRHVWDWAVNRFGDIASIHHVQDSVTGGAMNPGKGRRWLIETTEGETHKVWPSAIPNHIGLGGL